MTPEQRITSPVDLDRGVRLPTGLLLASVLFVSACAPQQQANPQPSPSPNALANAIETTATRGTAKITVTIDGDFGTLTGIGSTSLISPRGTITWESTDAEEDAWTELRTRKGLYSFIDDLWYLAPPETQTPTSGALAPLDGLNQLTEDSSGSLSGMLPLTMESALNFSEEELVDLPAECPREVSVKIDVNSDGIIERITKEFLCPQFDRLSVTELTDFGTSLGITEPEDAIEVPGNQ